jgi:hypothetical protein
MLDFDDPRPTNLMIAVLFICIAVLLIAIAQL